MYKAWDKSNCKMNGWLENLDQELEAVKTRQAEMASSQKSLQALVTTHEDQLDKEEEDQLTRSIRLFSERVTMAGVHDIHRAKSRQEKWTFIIAIFLGWIGAGLVAGNIAWHFAHEKTVYDRYPIVGYQPPFPNVTFCAPISMNRSIFQEFLVIPNRTMNMIKRMKLDLDEIIDFTFRFWRYDRYPHEVKNKLVVHASLQIMDATVVQFEHGYADFLLATYPKCDQILSNCYFGDRIFDCCKAAEFIFTYDRICYQINVQSIPDFKNSSKAIGGPVDDPIHVQRTGLHVNVSIDLSLANYFDELAQDGLHITIGALAVSHSNPTAIPSGADALVTIASKQINELTRCRSQNALPKLEFFDFYDPTGSVYYYDTGPVHAAVHEAGCDIPMLTHRPINTTYCMPFFFYALKTINEFDGVDVKSKRKSKIQDTDIHQELHQRYREALPICERWDYQVAIASYGYVRKSHQSDANDSNHHWSTVRVFFPSSSYLLLEEKPTDRPYMAIWRMGGVLTVYVGVSAIGLVQLVVYGFIVCESAIAKYKKRD